MFSSGLMLPCVTGAGSRQFHARDERVHAARRNGKVVPAYGQSFGDFMDGRLPALPGDHTTLDDWKAHLASIYLEVGSRRRCAADQMRVGVVVCYASLRCRCGDFVTE